MARNGVSVLAVVAAGVLAAAAAAERPARVQVLCPLAPPRAAILARFTPDGSAVSYTLPGRRAVEVAQPGSTFADDISLPTATPLRTVLWLGALGDPATSSIAYQDETGAIGVGDLRFGSRVLIPAAASGAAPLTLAGASPSGGTLLAVRSATQNDPAHVVAIGPGGDEHDLGPGYDPAWSPDGTRIAFAVSDGIPYSRQASLATMNPDGSDRRVVLAGLPRIDEVAWSPDSTRIAFSQGGALDVVGAGGGGIRFIAYGAGLIWRPTGLFFTATRLSLGAGPSVVERADPDTARTVVVVHGPGRIDASLDDVTLDGSRLAYELSTAPTGSLGIRVRSTDGRTDDALGRCYGTAAANDLYGSSLPDRIAAGSGDDVVHVVGGGADVVGCGPGRDTVYADRRDRVLRDCEHVRRL